MKDMIIDLTETGLSKPSDIRDILGHTESECWIAFGTACKLDFGSRKLNSLYNDEKWANTYCSKQKYLNTCVCFDYLENRVNLKRSYGLDYKSNYKSNYLSLTQKIRPFKEDIYRKNVKKKQEILLYFANRSIVWRDVN